MCHKQLGLKRVVTKMTGVISTKTFVLCQRGMKGSVAALGVYGVLPEGRQLLSIFLIFCLFVFVVFFFFSKAHLFVYVERCIIWKKSVVPKMIHKPDGILLPMES